MNAYKFFSIRTVIVLTAVLIAMNSHAGEFLGFFGGEKEAVYPASGFQGQVLYLGEPAVGALITRVFNQMDEGDFVEQVVADDEGRFTFSSVAFEYSEPWLSPVSYQSHQSITVTYQNVEVEIWRGFKTGKGEYSEFSGIPKNLVCELTEQKRSIRVDLGFFGTKCHWGLQ